MDNVNSMRFIFDKQTFSLETVWMEGYANGELDKPETNNPYPNKSPEYNYWLEGWESALYQDPPLFPEYAVDLISKNDIAANDIEINTGQLSKIDKMVCGGVVNHGNRCYMGSSNDRYCCLNNPPTQLSFTPSNNSTTF